MMKKKILATFNVAILAIGGLFAVPSIAYADESNDSPIECVPKDAWVEVVIHPAVGEPKITIDNPEYVEEIPGYNVENKKKTKWVWVGGPVSEAPSSPIINPAGWNNVGETNDKKGRDNPDVVLQSGNGNADYFYYETTFHWVDAIPAVGEPIIEVDNPDYIPEKREEINHEAVICDDPVIPEQPQTLVGDQQRISPPVCVIPLDGTQVSYLENRLWSQEWEWNEDIWDWTLGKRVYGDWELADTIIADNNECLPEDSTTPPVIEDGPEDPKPIIPTKDEAVDENQLAMTGSENSHMGIFAGLGLLSLGAAATIIPFVRKRMNA